MKEGGIFKADAEYNERKNKNGVYRDKMRVLLFFSEMIIPLILFYVVGFGVLMKCDIYEEFVKGAKEGLETVIQILPTLIGLMVAVGVLSASGFLTMLGEVLGKVTEPFGFPSALVPLTIVRMSSLLDVFREFGTDSRNGKIASIMMSCTETIFYTVSVYFMAAKIKDTRYTIAGAFLASAVGIAASVWLAGYMG